MKNKKRCKTKMWLFFTSHILVLKNRFFRSLSFFLLLSGVLSFSAKAQEISVTGTVVDTNDDPIPGVTIGLEGTTEGTITDIDGQYSLNNIPEDAVLVFSFIGMKTRQIDVDGRNTINVVMEDAVMGLDEVVVVGYGSQQKESVVGAISSISAKDIVQSPAASLNAGLAGKMPGLSIMMKDGELGRENAQTLIRGMATTNNSEPLILVDGVEREISTLNMHDIEQISIMKDASATSVFGVRGANGVILITTKRGGDMPTRVTVNTNYSLQKVTRLPEPLNAVDFMTVRNQVIDQHNKTTGQDTPLPYPDEIFDHYREGYLPEYYVDRNFFEEFMRDYTPMSRTTMNIRGGDEQTSFFGSVGYLKQGGPFITERWDEYNYDNEQRLERFNFRANINTKVNDRLDVWLNLSGHLQDKNDPTIFGAVDGAIQLGSYYSNMLASIADHNALSYPDLSPEGHVVNLPGSGRTPYGNLNRTGFRITTNNTINSTLGSKYDLDFITSGLSLRAIVSYDANTRHIRGYRRTYQNYNQELETDAHGNDSVAYVPGEGVDRELRKLLTQRNRNYFDLEASLNYDRSFGKHDVTGLFLYKQSQRTVNAEVPYNYLGVVGRVTYGYDRKYLSEVNFGYNGSEQFAPGRRYGFFPSVSLGWVLSEENWLSSSRVLDFLKIRGSYGQVGNDRITNQRFIYMDDWTQDQSNYFAGLGGFPGLPNPVYEAASSNPFVSWEVATKTNIGIESRFFRAFSLEIDLFHEERSSILITASKTPALITGQVNQAPTNTGVMENKGLEATLGYQNTTNGGFYYNTRLSSSFARNNVINMNEVPRDPSFAYQYRQEGFRRGIRWGYDALGYFESKEEINAWADQSGLGDDVFPGDLKYRDVNGDGVIDEKDMIPMKYPDVPELNFTFSTSLNYKGLDFSFLLQSVHNYNFNFSGRSVQDYGGNWPKNYFTIHKYAWTEEKAAEGGDIRFPRMHVDGESNGSNGNIPSNYWDMSLNYLRLRNVELGYTIPERLTSSLRIKSTRVYFNGSNLFVIDNMPFKYLDPEVNHSLSHPLYATYNFGINVVF